MSKNEIPKKLLEKKIEIRTTREVPLFLQKIAKSLKTPTICSVQ